MTRIKPGAGVFVVLQCLASRVATLGLPRLACYAWLVTRSLVFVALSLILFTHCMCTRFACVLSTPLYSIEALTTHAQYKRIDGILFTVAASNASIAWQDKVTNTAVLERAFFLQHIHAVKPETSETVRPRSLDG